MLLRTWKTDRVCFRSARCSIAFRSVKSDLLISAASLSVEPEVIVSLASSEPARSTRFARVVRTDDLCGWGMYLYLSLIHI